jgi:uncharacterized membrane protein
VDNRNFTTSNTTDDIYGHGTHVAGIAAANTNNGIGVAGLGYSCSIINVKVLGDDGMGYWSWVAQGIIWAADNGAQVINLSLGDSSNSSTVEDAINYAWNKGVVVVVAAGNEGNSDPFYPAYYPNCIAVAATDANDILSPWSNRGDWVDVAAPGDNILSTWGHKYYGSMSGTSMASPHVAGLAALVFTTVSDANGDGKLNDEVRDRIEASCDDIGVAGIGYGRINAARAVSSVPVPAGTISGQVTDDADGSAISGVEVSDGSRTALTDGAGSYTIDNVPPGSYQVVASKDGYESSSLTVTVLEGNTAAANLCLTRIIVPGSITGSITDAKDGSAISGAEVSDGSRTALTDALGTYTIDSVPPGSYQVVASKEGYESASLTVTVLEGSTAVANFSLSQIISPGSITGRVIDAADGLPLVGATVTDGTRTTTTDGTGKYTIANVLPGTYQATASKAGYYSSSVAVTVLAGNTVVADFSLNEVIVPGSITGTVTSAKDGSVMVGATVTDGTRTTTTDATGKYTIASVPPGAYQVTASKAGYHNSSLTVTVLSGGTAVANFSLSQIIVHGSITGSITNAEDGSAISGAEVSDGSRTALTDAIGTYTINNVPPGSYQVIASKEGYESSSLTVNLVSGTAAVANFSLSAIIVPGTITGSITNAEDGSAISGAEVSDGSRTALTDALGSYTINNVPPGSYQVVASEEGYETVSLAVDVLPEATAVANFYLSEIVVPGSITGTVADAKDGSPIVGATVSDGTRTATTDASGKYIIVDVPAGSHEVIASKEGYESVTSSATVVSGETALVNFSLNQKPPATNAMWVDNIRFIKNGKDLFIEAKVVTASGVLRKAKVGLRLECSNGKVWNFSGTTGTAGLVKFKVRNALVGSYVATVTSLTRSGFTWDMSRGITSASYALSR